MNRRVLTELNPEQEFLLQPRSQTAYCVCCRYERELGTEDDRRRVRILGFLLLFAHKNSARAYLANSILCIKDDPLMLVMLGQVVERHVILPFKTCRGQVLNSSHHLPKSSPAGYRRVQITEAPRNHTDAKELVFLRDRGRCAITGYFDLTSPDAGRGPGIFAECAYIIPSAASFSVTEKSSKLDYSVTISTLLELFYHDIHEFTGERVYSLTNVLTMEKGIKDYFDQLFVYLEPVNGKSDVYEVKHLLRSLPLQVPQFVQLSTNDPEYLPLPDPDLLALHATICKVACMSGAAEYIDSAVAYK